MLAAVILAVLMLIGVGIYVYLDNLVNEGDAGQLTPDIVPTQPEISKKVINLPRRFMNLYERVCNSCWSDELLNDLT